MNKEVKYTKVFDLDAVNLKVGGVQRCLTLPNNGQNTASPDVEPRFLVFGP